MRKKALLALMMAAVLLLSGCNLIKKDQAVDDATEIIRMGDQVITKKEVKAQTEQELYEQYLPGITEFAKEQLVKGMVSEQLVYIYKKLLSGKKQENKDSFNEHE